MGIDSAWNPCQGKTEFRRQRYAESFWNERIGKTVSVYSKQETYQGDIS